LRRGDAVRVGRPHVRDGVIRFTTEKTGERVAVPVSDPLAEALAAGPCGDLTFICGANGGPLVKEAFGNVFREWCNAAGVNKSAHGLRKAAATADALAGFTDAELDAKFGWQGRKMASLYTRTASRERLSLAAAERVKARTKSPAPSTQGAGLSAKSPVETTGEIGLGGPGRTRTCNQTVSALTATRRIENQRFAPDSLASCSTSVRRSRWGSGGASAAARTVFCVAAQSEVRAVADGQLTAAAERRLKDGRRLKVDLRSI